MHLPCPASCLAVSLSSSSALCIYCKTLLTGSSMLARQSCAVHRTFDILASLVNHTERRAGASVSI